MNDEGEHIVPIVNRLSIEDLRNMLSRMSDIGGSDLFVSGGRPVIMRLHSRLVRVTKRAISEEEVYGLLRNKDVYGDNAPSRLGGRDPINTSLDFRQDGKRYRYRVNAVGCTRNGRNSATITIRTIPTTPPTTEELGLEADIVDICNRSSQGLVLVTGATGNGKSTTLAALIRGMIEGEGKNRNVVTIQEPIEFVYDDIDQPDSLVTDIEVGRAIRSFHEGVVNAMRMAPTTILIGESRDYETVSAAVEASVTGHVAFSTVHTNSVAETLQRLVSLYPESLQHQARMDIVQALRMIVTQRLVPSADGRRAAIREYLIFDQNVKSRLYAASNVTAETLALLREGGQPMVEDARKKFEEGIISEEVFEQQKVNYAAREEVS